MYEKIKSENITHFKPVVNEKVCIYSLNEVIKQEIIPCKHSSGKGCLLFFFLIRTSLCVKLKILGTGEKM